MTKYEIATLLISLIALLISIISARYSDFVNKRLTSSDYKASERVKSDIVKLIVTLRSIMHKYARYTYAKSPEGTIDISLEKRIINDFICSSTGLAFYSWVAQKSADANSSNNKGEPWRVFFMYLVDIIDSNNVIIASNFAANVELLIAKLTEEDIEKIIEFNLNLPKSIAKIIKNGGGDPIIQALLLIETEKSKEKEAEG